MSTLSLPASPHGLVLADVVPGSRLRDAALVAGGALVTAALAQVTVEVPPSPVPVTGQTLAVGLVGATLGLRRGASSLLLYLLLGLVLPVYADGASGPSVVWGPSGGYLVGFVVAAAAAGWLAEHGGDRRVVTAFAGFVVVQLIVFAFGLAGLKLAVGETWGWTVHNGFTVFLLGGALKALLGAGALPFAWRLAGRLDRR